MTRRAVVVCPGRGTYGKDELGYLKHLHADKSALFAGFDAQRIAAGQEPVTRYDAADRYSLAVHSRGDVASPLIYACSLADAQSLSEQIEPVAVTGNSMGWYIALAVAGAVTPTDGFTICNTMGRLMQDRLIGGQLVYPTVGPDWIPDAAREAELLAVVDAIDARPDHRLALSIRLGGMLVLAGNEVGLKAFESMVERIDDRVPMRLANHAAFHTDLQKPVAETGRGLLGLELFGTPKTPLVDGRGHVWWPYATHFDDLRTYTLDHQVVEAYDFTRAIQTAAREFNPDLFILTGPGGTLGGAVAQSLIAVGWKGLSDKASFQRRQEAEPILASMGMTGQRGWVA